MVSGKEAVPAQEIETEYSKINRYNFPPDFIFGTATSAYQVEGGAAKGGRGLSVWDAFSLKTPGKIADGSNGNEAADMYTRYKGDIKIMKYIGFDAYRFSISWSRILPGGKLSLGVNREGIDYYNDVINTLVANGIQPYVTLFHWDLPFALEQEYGGFLSKDIVNDFRDFAELCFWEFGDRVKHWITLNEPSTYAVHGYVGCSFPPGKLDPNIKATSTNPAEKELLKKYDPPRRPEYNFIPYKGFNGVERPLDLFKYGAVDEETMDLMSEASDDPDYASKYNAKQAKDSYIVGRNLLLAHAAAVKSYRDRFQAHQKGKIGIALVSHWFEPYSCEESDVNAAKRALDFMLGWYLEPVLVGRYPQNMIDFVDKENLAPFTDEESNLLKGSIDFLGLNYYTSCYVQDDPEPDVTSGYNKDMQIKTYSIKDKKPIGEPTDVKWLNVVPWGIYKLLKNVNNTYNNCTYKLPEIFITENGFADIKDHKLTAHEACRDTKRVKYYRDHLGNILKARREGVKVKGYFAWAWCDNFEWDMGHTHRFGMIYIQYVNHLKRFPKYSAKWFAKFLEKKKMRDAMWYVKFSEEKNEKEIEDTLNVDKEKKEKEYEKEKKMEEEFVKFIEEMKKVDKEHVI